MSSNDDQSTESFVAPSDCKISFDEDNISSAINPQIKLEVSDEPENDLSSSNLISNNEKPNDCVPTSSGFQSTLLGVSPTFDTSLLTARGLPTQLGFPSSLNQILTHALPSQPMFSSLDLTTNMKPNYSDPPSPFSDLTSSFSFAVSSTASSVTQSPSSQSGDVCIICQDRASGRHYGVISCEGCKGFFKRSVKKGIAYSCRSGGSCPVDRNTRNRCQFCRLQKCRSVGMRSESVQMRDRSIKFREPFKSSFTETSSVTSISECKTEMSPEFSYNQILNNSGLEFNFASLTPPKEDTSGNKPKPIVGIATHFTSSTTNDSAAYKAFDSLQRLLTSNNDSNIDPTDALVYEGPIITEANVRFVLQTPISCPEVLNVTYICETASRLLFLSVHWARNLSAFSCLPNACSTGLMKSCWHEMFVLGLSQCADSMSLSAMLTAVINNIQGSLQQGKLTAEKVHSVMNEIWKLKKFVSQMGRLEITPLEYAYLRVFVLFSPDHATSDFSRPVEQLQDLAHAELASLQYNDESSSNRLPKLLLRLPTLRSMDASILEELFFRGLIGEVPIDSVIPYILSMKTKEFDSTFLHSV